MRPLVPALVLALLSACGNSKVSESECQAFVAHFEALMNDGPEAEKTRDLAAKMVPEMQRQCLSEAKPEEIRCALEAKDIDAFQACGQGAK